MKKTIALVAAIGLASAAYGQTTAQPATDDAAELIPLPETTKTQTYDGPNSAGAPGQPAPTDADAKLTAAEGRYTAQTRGEYPFCSATVRDNCRQRRDPGY